MAKEGKRKKPIYKRWWVWIVAIIIIIGIAGANSGGSDTASTDTAATTTKADDKTDSKTDATKKAEPKKETPKKKETTVKIGQPLEVGKVTFTVNDVKTADSVGGEFGQKAQGQYIILSISVKNGDKKAITTDSSFFKLKKGDTEYEADGAASIFANDQSANFLVQQVNPGIENKGNVVFDIPKDIKPADLTLQVQTGFFGTETGIIKLTK